jgi:hypothetical protein
MNASASRAQPSSPYRVSARESAGEPIADSASIFGSVLLLIASLLRLIRPMEGLEEFGAEPTIALFTAVLSSAHLLSTARTWLSRSRDRRAQGEGYPSSPEGTTDHAAGPSPNS